MKVVLPIFALVSSVSLALAEALPPLPAGTLPNTETSTNIALNVSAEKLQTFLVTLELDASGSNSLSVAIGEASGEELALEEADFAWGYDCGAWFFADTSTGEMREEAETGSGRVSRTLAISRRDFRPDWNMMRIVKRGLGDIGAGCTVSQELVRFTVSVR